MAWITRVAVTKHAPYMTAKGKRQIEQDELGRKKTGELTTIRLNDHLAAKQITVTRLEITHKTRYSRHFHKTGLLKHEFPVPAEKRPRALQRT